jgi:hypothetical protein
MFAYLSQLVMVIIYLKQNNNIKRLDGIFFYCRNGVSHNNMKRFCDLTDRRIFCDCHVA